MRLSSMLAWSLFLATLGCGAPSTLCTTGRVETCPCLGGGSGVQTCHADGTFGACTCPGTDAGGTDAGSTEDAATVGTDSSIDADVLASDTGSTDAHVNDAPTDAGAVHGHVVLIGHDGLYADEAVDPMIANAVLLTERPGEIRVLEYVQYTGSGAANPRVQTLLDDAAAAAGRTLSHRPLADAFGLGAALATTDVLLVYPQPSTLPSTLQLVADGWHDDLVSFVGDGGVVVVLSTTRHGVGGGSEGPGDEWRIVSGTGLFNATYASFSYASGLIVDIVAPADPVADGVLTPYSPREVVCFPSSTGGVLVGRTSASSTDVAPLCPVIRHLVD